MSSAPSRRTVLASAASLAAISPFGLATAQPAPVPREKTMILVWSGSREGRWVDYELWNPYSIGSNHQNGPNLIYEPLASITARSPTRCICGWRKATSSRLTSSN